MDRNELLVNFCHQNIYTMKRSTHFNLKPTSPERIAIFTLI